jgi:hypothetical protein
MGFSREAIKPRIANGDFRGFPIGGISEIDNWRLFRTSPLEGGGFEPSVPRDSDDGFRSNSPAWLLPLRETYGPSPLFAPPPNPKESQRDLRSR